ncbi:hypothetical protein EAI_12956 [Harpegnathos saltator]|uniref:Uncharacterized protein n=1 Tax=Harpegnathos saltator TaxID=610380 RepID=E2BZ39_HARSA|nr:hypothetical protein EAI_12956 [Harpegnathos saltator]
MAVEIKQTLKRKFDVYLTAQDIRNFTFEKPGNMADKDKGFEQTKISNCFAAWLPSQTIYKS